MRDQERNGKIQDGIMAGRVGLSTMISEDSSEVAVMSPNAGGETAVEDSESNGSESKYSRSCAMTMTKS